MLSLPFEALDGEHTNSTELSVHARVKKHVKRRQTVECVEWRTLSYAHTSGAAHMYETWSKMKHLWYFLLLAVPPYV